MMRLLYNLGIRLYVTGIHIASLWNFKAKQWVKGRALWIEELGKASGGFKEHVIWFHCASLGEFEMARPLMEKIKAEQPQYSILLTFFSPSGYDVRKNWKGADYVMYLPADTRSNANAFVKIVNPQKAVFVKYEYWLNYLDALHYTHVDTFMVCAVYRKDQAFFKWYGKPFRFGLTRFKEIFVQTEYSKELALKLGFDVVVAGDMRYDRVTMAARQNQLSREVAAFCQTGFTIVCGSTWPEEEKLICPWMNSSSAEVKMIIAPHDISEEHLKSIEERLKVQYVRYSKLNEATENTRVIIVDNIGMLGTLYKAGKIAVVGGGFSGALHNILEPAVYGVPVLFGPKYKKFHEAASFMYAGGAFSFSDLHSFDTLIQRFKKNEDERKKAGNACLKIVADNEGATQLIYDQMF